jgi:hypothetical protein
VSPQRIQQKRQKGWRMPPNSVSVTRPGPYGNPFKANVNVVRLDGTAYYRTSQMAVEQFREWLAKPEQQTLVERARKELRGKNVACFCHEDSLYCHGDVWIEVANA